MMSVWVREICLMMRLLAAAHFAHWQHRILNSRVLLKYKIIIIFHKKENIY